MIHAHLEAARVDALHAEVAVGAAAEAAVEPVAVDDAVRVGRGGVGLEHGGEVDQGDVPTIRLGLLDSSGFRKYSTLLVIQLFSRRLCLCHCLCIRLCLCICVPYSFLNSYYHKLSENVWVWGSRGSRSGDLVRCHHSGTTTEQKGKIGLLSHWTMEG